METKFSEIQAVTKTIKGDLWTIKEILDWSSHFLVKAGSDSPRLDVELLLSEVLGLSRIELYVNFDRPVTVEERVKFKILLKKRARLEPIAYILGRREFYGYVFEVNKFTLIPRPETEHIVSWVVENFNKPGLKVLDVGTGTGCLGLSIAKELEDSALEGWDISSECIEVTKSNARSLGLELSTEFMVKDALQENSWDLNAKTFDLIVSNPPYVDKEDIRFVARETAKHEPSIALFSEDSGLEFYKIFAKYARKLLKPKSPILVEIGYNQSQEVMNIFKMSGWSDIEVIYDYSGHGRVVVAFSN